MKLREIKTKTTHFFLDEQDRYQGEYKTWWINGHQMSSIYYRNARFHGEYKTYYDTGRPLAMCNYLDNKLHGDRKIWSSTGELRAHTFYINGEKTIDFIKNPELYPSTPEEKLMFVLKYGNAPFIGDSSETT